MAGSGDIGSKLIFEEGQYCISRVGIFILRSVTVSHCFVCFFVRREEELCGLVIVYTVNHHRCIEVDFAASFRFRSVDSYKAVILEVVDDTYRVDPVVAAAVISDEWTAL